MLGHTNRTKSRSFIFSTYVMDIARYHETLAEAEREICLFLFETFHAGLPGSAAKIWHAHPVWFIDGNPIAGYSKLKNGIRVLFWSGQSFVTAGLTPEGKFKAAEIRITNAAHCKQLPWKDWLFEATTKQWDYQNIVKRKGQLIPRTTW